MRFLLDRMDYALVLRDFRHRRVFLSGKVTSAQFLKDRFKRLMVPFALVAWLLILPVHVYYEAVFKGSFAGNFVDFYLGPCFTKQ